MFFWFSKYDTKITSLIFAKWHSVYKIDFRLILKLSPTILKLNRLHFQELTLTEYTFTLDLDY